MRFRIFDLLSLAAILALVFGFFLRDEIGRIEGSIWPVVGPITMEVVETDGPVTIFSFFADKLRSDKDCQWRGTRWFFGEPGASVPIPTFAHLDRPRIREEGQQVWKRNTVQIPPADLLGNSYGVAAHDCGGLRWWLVYTILAPERKSDDTQN